MLPTDAKARKAIPVSTGCFAYFPDALVAVAELSQIANDQHNPGEPLHWAKEKSTDEADALARHQLQHIAGELYDTDGILHATKVAWRALAQLQRLLDTQITRRTEPAPMQEMLDEAGLPWGAASPLTAGDGMGRCGWVPPPGFAAVSCILPHNHSGPHACEAVRPPSICSDCGADLDNGVHASTCLRLNQPMY